MRWNKGVHTAITLFIIHITSSRPTSNTAPAVFEVVNEQARMDENRVLPYSNPLAGNSKSNAKLHAQHQQAMYNAERIRQHRAQLQRWHDQHTRQQVDSYMKAYQESQENHHLALEQMQIKSKDRKTKIRPERQLKELPDIAPGKITRGEAQDKNRNHRSYGSIYTTVQKNHNFNSHPIVTKGYAFDQGITMKPNGNLGLYNLEKEHRSMYTAAIPSKTHYVYPKLYSQMHGYQSANDINTLQSLLKKPAQDQLTQLNTLIPTTTYPDKDIQDKPSDLYFYLNDPHIDNLESAQISFPGLYAAHYINHKDHKPITEEIQDIPDINDSRIRTYLKPATPTVITQVHDNAMATESYFKIEHEHPVSKNLPKNVEYVPEEKPKYEKLVYHKPKSTHQHRPSSEGIKYLQSQPTRVQHLNQDGSETSSYGDEDVSIDKNRTKREIDATLFVLANETVTNTTLIQKNDSQLLNDTIFIESNCSGTVGTVEYTNETYFVNNTVVLETNDNLPTPEELKRNGFVDSDSSHRIGEAYDYDYTYDEDDPNSKDYSYENDDDYEYSIPDFDYDPSNIRPRTTHRPRQHNPNINEDSDGSFSNRYSNFRHPNFYDYHSEPNKRNYRAPRYGPPKQQYGPPKQQYGPPKQQYGPPTQQYSPPNQHYGPPNQEYQSANTQYGSLSTDYGLPLEQYGPPFNQAPNPIPQYGHITNPTPQSYPNSQVSNVISSLEPVYMLTHTQLKELVGQKLNIEHLDVFQLSPENKPKHPGYPRKRGRKSRRRNPKKGRKNRIGKIRKLNKIIMY